MAMMNICREARYRINGQTPTPEVAIPDVFAVEWNPRRMIFFPDTEFSQELPSLRGVSFSGRILTYDPDIAFTLIDLKPVGSISDFYDIKLWPELIVRYTMSSVIQSGQDAGKPVKKKRTFKTVVF